MPLQRCTSCQVSLGNGALELWIRASVPWRGGVAALNTRFHIDGTDPKYVMPWRSSVSPSFISTCGWNGGTTYRSQPDNSGKMQLLTSGIECIGSRQSERWKSAVPCSSLKVTTRDRMARQVNAAPLGRPVVPPV